MLNDPGRVEALEPVKEIHAIRLKMQDETSDMTMEERVEFINNRARESLARYGLSSQIVNLHTQEKALQQEAVLTMVI
jgi:hypothetical protein